MDENNKLNIIAQRYHLNVNEDSFIENINQEHEINWFVKMLQNEDEVLELGFGDGITFKNLHDKCKLTILEGSSMLYEKAKLEIKKNKSSAKIILTYFEDFKATNKFDWIFASHVLEHVDDPIFILNKISEWLKPNGKLLVIVPNKESLHRRVAVALKLQENLESLSERDVLVGHKRVYGIKELNSQLLEANFKLLIARGFFVKSLANFQLKNLPSKIIHGLNIISKDLPPEFCANIALVAEKSNNDK